MTQPTRARAARNADDRPEALAARLVAERPPEWLDRLSDELDQRRIGRELQRTLEVWGLSQAEAARLFGVSRQAIGKWIATGVPADRTPAVADLAAATDLLVRHLRRERIPAVVRRAAPIAGEASLLDLAGDDPRRALDAVRAMFDLSGISA